MPILPSGPDSQGISAQGTIIKRNGTAIGELKDITPPPLSRKTIDTTTQNSEDDQYVVGIRRKGELTFMVNFLPSADATHGTTNGLLDAWATGSKDLYEIDFPDTSSWAFSGFVVGIAPTAKVDSAFEAQVTIRPSGSQTITP